MDLRPLLHRHLIPSLQAENLFREDAEEESARALRDLDIDDILRRAEVTEGLLRACLARGRVPLPFFFEEEREEGLKLGGSLDADPSSLAVESATQELVKSFNVATFSVADETADDFWSKAIPEEDKKRVDEEEAAARAEEDAEVCVSCDWLPQIAAEGASASHPW